MGHCCSKNVTATVNDNNRLESLAPSSEAVHSGNGTAEVHSNYNKDTPAHSFSAGPFQTHYPAGVDPTPSWTPKRFFKWPFPPPSPAKPIMSANLKRQDTRKSKERTPAPEVEGGAGGERALDKTFGYPKNLSAKYELEKEVGRGHFGHTCSAKGKKGQLKNQPVAVKIISKAKMKTAIEIEDVRRELKILKAFSGHKSTVKFYDAFEDAQNVYVVMEYVFSLYYVKVENYWIGFYQEVEDMQKRMLKLLFCRY